METSKKKSISHYARIAALTSSMLGSTLSFAYGDSSASGDFGMALDESKGVLLRVEVNEDGEENTSSVEMRLYSGDEAPRDANVDDAWDLSYEVDPYDEVEDSDNEDSSTRGWFNRKSSGGKNKIGSSWKNKKWGHKKDHHDKHHDWKDKWKDKKKDHHNDHHDRWKDRWDHRNNHKEPVYSIMPVRGDDRNDGGYNSADPDRYNSRDRYNKDDRNIWHGGRTHDQGFKHAGYYSNFRPGYRTDRGDMSYDGSSRTFDRNDGYKDYRYYYYPRSEGGSRSGSGSVGGSRGGFPGYGGGRYSSDKDDDLEVIPPTSTTGSFRPKPFDPYGNGNGRGNGSGSVGGSRGGFPGYGGGRYSSDKDDDLEVIPPTSTTGSFRTTRGSYRNQPSRGNTVRTGNSSRGGSNFSDPLGRASRYGYGN